MKRLLLVPFLALASVDASAEMGPMPNPIGGGDFGGFKMRPAGTGGGTPDDSPSGVDRPTNNPSNINQRNVTRNEDKKEPPKSQQASNNKGTPSMPSASNPGGKDDAGGGEGGGGACNKSSELVAKDAAKLDEAVNTLSASKDPALKGLGKSLTPYSVADSKAKTAIREATDRLQAAKDKLEQAVPKLKEFADKNRTDVDKIKKVAESAKSKGNEAKECSGTEAGKADKVEGDPSRTATFPGGADGQVSDARSAVDEAAKAVKELKAQSAKLSSTFQGHVTNVVTMQKKIGSAIDGMNEMITDAEKNAREGAENLAKALEDVEAAVKAAEDALKAAHKADDTAKKAAETAKTSQTAMNKDNAAVTTGQPQWNMAPTTEAKEAACTTYKSAITDHKAQGPKPEPDAKAADDPATQAKDKAATAEEKLGAIGTL